MDKKIIFFICTIFLCSTLSWGQSQTWKLTKTMTAELTPDRWLTISSTAASEAMPNFTRKNPAPWKSLHSNFGVRIVGNITSIGNYAFAGCDHLTFVDFFKPRAEGQTWEDSNCLTSIGEGAFEDCLQLTIGSFKNAIHFPKSLTAIGKYAFKGCTNIESVHFPNSLTSIGNGAFQGCTGLTFISVKWETPLHIPDSVFASLNAEVICLSIPNGVKSQYENAKVWKSFQIKTKADFDAIPYDDNPVKDSQIRMNLFINRVIGEKALALIILSMSVILFFMRISREDESQQDTGFGISHILMRISREGYNPRQGAAYVVSTILFLITCSLQILYVSSVDDPTWFCSPDRVGWIWTIINFFLFGIVVYNQILYLFDVMSDVLVNGNAECDLKMGVYTWIGGFIAELLCSFFFKKGLPLVLAVVCLLQLVQAALIFRSYGRNIKGAFGGVFVYLLGSIGTILIILHFFTVLIFVLIGWVVLKFLTESKSSPSSSNSSSSNATMPGQRCRNCNYYPGNGYNCSHKYRGNISNYMETTVHDNDVACRFWESDSD